MITFDDVLSASLIEVYIEEVFPDPHVEVFSFIGFIFLVILVLADFQIGGG